MSDVVLANLDDLRQVVADLLDASSPLVVDRKDASRLLAVSDTTFGRLVNDGVIRPVPHLRPKRYSLELLRRFAAGDETAFVSAGASTSATGLSPRPVAGVDGPSGAIGADPTSFGGSVSPLPVARREAGRQANTPEDAA